MKKIKDPALFEKIRKFLTEDMPVLRKKSPNTVEAYRYTLNIYLVFLCEKHSKSLYNITVKDFSQKNILFFFLSYTSHKPNQIVRQVSSNNFFCNVFRVTTVTVSIKIFKNYFIFLNRKCFANFSIIFRLINPDRNT